MGGNVIVNLALLHPRLSTGIIAIEPAINLNASNMNYFAVYPIMMKQDLFRNREAAGAHFASTIHKYWDKEALESFCQYGLRDTPTPLHETPKESQSGKVPVTLTTTKHQELSLTTKPVIISQYL